MPYSINPVAKDQCVFLTFNGPMKAVDVVAIRYEAIALLVGRHWCRMVVDIRELRTLTPLELFVFARGLSTDLPKNSRAALVMRREQNHTAGFIQKIIPKDVALLSFFPDQEQALAWVKGNAAPESRRPMANARDCVL
jgi:hypothetical protein